jgi:hypothetical protein
MKTYFECTTAAEVTAHQFNESPTAQVLDWCPHLVLSYRDRTNRLVGIMLVITQGVEHRTPVAQGDWLVKSITNRGPRFSVLSDAEFRSRYQEL